MNKSVVRSLRLSLREPMGILSLGFTHDISDGNFRVYLFIGDSSG